MPRTWFNKSCNLIPSEGQRPSTTSYYIHSPLPTFEQSPPSTVYRVRRNLYQFFTCTILAALLCIPRQIFLSIGPDYSSTCSEGRLSIEPHRQACKRRKDEDQEFARGAIPTERLLSTVQVRRLSFVQPLEVSMRSRMSPGHATAPENPRGCSAPF